MALDEHRLTVEHVDIGIGDLAVDAEDHANRLHPLEHRREVREVGDAMRGVGRRVRGIELGRGEHPLGLTAREFAGIGGVGEIGGHQRREIRVRRQRGEDPLAVATRLLDRDDRRREVGHHDRARELACGVRRDAAQHRAVAQVHVPVVGAANGEARHRRAPWHSGGCLDRLTAAAAPAAA
jgi:hypothetical protein